MLCKEDSTALTSYMKLVTDGLGTPLTDAPERRLEASIMAAIEDYLDLQSEASIAAKEQGLLLLMIPQELTYVLDRVLTRCLRDWGTELPFNLQLADDGTAEPELEITPREPTEKSVRKIAAWVMESMPEAAIDDKPFLGRLILILRSWLRQKSFDKAAEDFHQKSVKRHDDGPSI